MAYQKLQVSSASIVIPSNTVNIPTPDGPTIETAVDTTGPNNEVLMDDTTFTDDPLLKRGATIINTTDLTIGTIEKIVGPGVVEVGAAFYGSLAAGKGIAIYPLPNFNAQQGCIIYVGDTSGGGDVHVLTCGGTEVVYKNVPQGSFLPVQVLRVNTSLTTAQSLIANW